jgi:hypothetical protein
MKDKEIAINLYPYILQILKTAARNVIYQGTATL